MKQPTRTLYAMALALTLSTSSCAALANPFVQSILIKLGKIVSETIIIKITEELMDRWIFDKTVMDKATEGVNSFYGQVAPLPDNMRQGRIPVKGFLAFEVNGARQGVQTSAILEIPYDLIHFQRESITSVTWTLTSYSEGMIRNQLNLAAAQISLQNRGFLQPEKIGEMDEQTIRALKAFQKCKGLLETGKLDEATKEILFVE